MYASVSNGRIHCKIVGGENKEYQYDKPQQWHPRYGAEISALDYTSVFISIFNSGEYQYVAGRFFVIPIV